MARLALLSVSDKTGIIELARKLVEEFQFDLISSGGTAKALQAAGLPVTKVSDYTGHPEILGGRVKTLHPRIHGGILGRRDVAQDVADMENNGIRPIDLVVVNLYPFAETIAKPNVTLPEAIEQIDIGGPAMLRASAKNYPHLTVLCNPNQYEAYLAQLRQQGNSPTLEFRQACAIEAFSHTAAYDSAIATYLSTTTGVGSGEWGVGSGDNSSIPTTSVTSVTPSVAPSVTSVTPSVAPSVTSVTSVTPSVAPSVTPSVAQFALSATQIQPLRYGENPHQPAAWYQTETTPTGWAAATKIQGKELSYNNLVDLEAARQIIAEFTDNPAAVIIKHNNPCGVALGSTLSEAYQKAFNADSVSAFGGIVALNKSIDAATAKELSKTFLECIVAPDCEADAKEIIAAKSNLRVLLLPDLKSGATETVKVIAGGLLVQAADDIVESPDNWQVVTEKQPTPEELAELLFAWQVCKHVKSNAIVVTCDRTTLGIGAGQMNRVGSVKIALEQAGAKTQGASLASDGFFPFDDSVRTAAGAGITAIVQPGGSMRDKDSIQAANELGLVMVLTGIRHFLH